MLPRAVENEFNRDFLSKVKGRLGLWKSALQDHKRIMSHQDPCLTFKAPYIRISPQMHLLWCARAPSVVVQKNAVFIGSHHAGQPAKIALMLKHYQKSSDT